MGGVVGSVLGPLSPRTVWWPDWVSAGCDWPCAGWCLALCTSCGRLLRLLRGRRRRPHHPVQSVWGLFSYKVLLLRLLQPEVCANCAPNYEKMKAMKNPISGTSLTQVFRRAAAHGAIRRKQQPGLRAGLMEAMPASVCFTSTCLSALDKNYIISSSDRFPFNPTGEH